MNTKLFGLFIALLVCLPSLAQQKPVEKVDSDGVYLMPDQMPEFPGGVRNMNHFINSHLRYPVIAQENGTQGRVTCQFVVGADGRVRDVNVLRGVDPYLDKEAVRVIMGMPKWKPGMQRGKPVRVKYTVPVMFRLQ